jgi:hypothetical protein
VSTKPGTGRGKIEILLQCFAFADDRRILAQRHKDAKAQWISFKPAISNLAICVNLKVDGCRGMCWRGYTISSLTRHYEKYVACGR